MQVHEAGFLGRVGKMVAPPLSRLVSGPRCRKSIRLLEIYLQILQGRGAGTGWDLHGEIIAAQHFLRGVDSPVIFDVGANFGQWTTCLQAALGTSAGSFFMFEPQSACQPTLTRMSDSRRVLIPAAVGDKPGSATIFSDTPGSGVASVHMRRDSYFGDLTAYQDLVPVTTIDREVKKRRIDHIDLLKLDIEGAELAALRGASTSLEERRIATIAFEFGSANVYSRIFFRDFWDLLDPLGYRLWRICPGGTLLALTEYVEELEHFRGVSNYIASLNSFERGSVRRQPTQDGNADPIAA
ncbi:FkbM family methyltransferase [Streptomyces sp. NPDC001792]|uniref:FkbM family methyltransferase n=1 Tax=Streptomyces sp. NPDC001792 TaxID=3154524 RepID=UPI003327D9C0